MKRTIRNFALSFTVFLLAGSYSSASLAGGKESMALFYLSIKGIQVTALSGVSDMWTALGSAAKAEECLGLARDLQKGDLANEDGMKKYVAANAELSNTLEEYEQAGLPLSRAQQKAVQKAYLKIAGTTVMWVAATASVVNLVKTNDLNMLEKVVIGVAMAGEVKSAASSTSELMGAWKSYRELAKGGSVRPLSKELAPQFASL